MEQHYTAEEANEILQRAIERQALPGDMTRTQLEAVAAEVGVTPAALDSAEEEWRTESENHSLRYAFDEQKRAEVRGHVFSYLAVNTFLAAINAMVSPGVWWVAFPVLGWGLGLFFHVMAAYNLIGEDRDAEFERWLARQPENIESGSPENVRKRLVH